jgi:AcrR family transcriptional regulator
VTTETVQREDGRRANGRRSREAILAEAVQLASTEGLEGLTINRLASRVEMSKSGLFAHFGSKQELQLAAIERAHLIFTAEVVVPAVDAPPGLAQLRALLEAWLSYFERGVFAGGCFFIAASSEFDDRGGPVRDAVDAAMADWVAFLERLCADAIAAGEVPGADPAQLAFELNAIGIATNWELRLRHNDEALTRAGAAFKRVLSTGGDSR